MECVLTIPTAKALERQGSFKTQGIPMQRTLAPTRLSAIVKFVLIAIVTVGLLAPSVEASILLTVDARDPSMVIFEATAGLSAFSSTGQGFGVELKGAITADGTQAEFLFSPPSTFLKPAQGGDLFRFYGDSGTSIVLNAGGSSQQKFTIGELAFTGSTTVNLSFMEFATSDFVGDIEVRDSFGALTGEILGQFQFLAPATVPEPATFTIWAVAMTLLAQRRRW
jgi:hypothetical protein